jgi:NhaP-type Na+/H+ or K+/H+ antiporter
MGIGFPEALLVLGLLLGVVAALSGWLQSTVLSMAVLSLATGIGLALAGVLDPSPSSEAVLLAVELALILTLFADGLAVERELLVSHWTPAVRALVLAMPLTLLLIALAGKALFPALTWSEAFLLGAVLSPTDPVVTSSVVTSERIPATIRHTLNLESGLNDGLALPFVLFFLVLATGSGEPLVEGGRLALEAGIGAVIGIGLAVVAGRLIRSLPSGGITAKYEGIYALGVALASFGVAEASSWGNGLIAAFVGGIALAVSRHEIPDEFAEFNESVSSIFQIAVFVLFGALVVTTGWDGSIARLVVFVGLALLVARPAAVLVSFTGVREPRANKLFMAWFGPKGVASILFALLVLASSDSHRSLIFDIASFTILTSILAHGLTDTVGATWLERRLPREEAADPGVPAASESSY